MLTPGAFPAESFPGGTWMDNSWPEYGIQAVTEVRKYISYGLGMEYISAGMDRDYVLRREN